MSIGCVKWVKGLLKWGGCEKYTIFERYFDSVIVKDEVLWRVKLGYANEN
jgi:hypothetical protein